MTASCATPSGLCLLPVEPCWVCCQAWLVLKMHADAAARVGMPAQIWARMPMTLKPYISCGVYNTFRRPGFKRAVNMRCMPATKHMLTIFHVATHMMGTEPEAHAWPQVGEPADGLDLNI